MKTSPIIILKLKTEIYKPNLPNLQVYGNYRNPSFGLMTKARACKVAGQEGSPGITPHALGNVGKCEGMNLHTLKGASILGIGIPVDFQIFRE